MKLLCLNTWGGNLKEELRGFITKRAASIDIFCFQEVFENATHPRIKTLGDIDENLYTNIRKLLPNHIGYYAPSQDNDEGLAIFVKPSLRIVKIGDFFVYRHHNALENNDGATLGRNIQYAQFKVDDQNYTVINFHGLWNGEGKGDSLGRIEQSQKIRAFIETQTAGKVILVGDFNLDPNTESIAILEEDMRNLIKEYDITSTRSDLYKRPNKFADYAFVSNNLHVRNFEVLQDQVSDHLPLYLEFS